MSRADAWMPLYIGDYLADTMHLTAAEHGAYLLLLMHEWRSGPLPDDDRQLAAIARVDLAAWRKGIGATVRRFFTTTPDGLAQKRLEAERAKVAGVIDKRTEAGKRGAASRWQKDASANAGEDSKPMANAMAEPMANAWQTDGQSQSQSQKKERTPSQPSAAPVPTPQERPDGWVGQWDGLRSNGSNPRNVGTSPRQQAQRGVRLHPDWRPEPDEAGFAHKLGLNPDAVAAAFRDFWHAKPGKDALKVDWSATWRSWCRREAERGPQRAGGRQPESKLGWMTNPHSEKPQ